MKVTEPKDKITAVGVSAPPPGMTQEEMDRLIREADEAEAAKEKN